jgi:phosphoribosyl-ATP pyrophosphohydrolase
MTHPPGSLGEEINALANTIASRADADPDASYTAQLLAAGPLRAAKKFGEEAVEAILAAAGARETLADEAADVIYHLLVMLKASDVSPGDVAARLAARAGRSGLDEKASR